MVGLIPDLTRVCGQAWQSKGFNLSPRQQSVEARSGDVGVFRYLATIHDTVAGLPPLVDFLTWNVVLQTACRQGFVRLRSAHDCAEGGLAIALSEACISGALGEINLGLTITQLKNSHGAG